MNRSLPAARVEAASLEHYQAGRLAEAIAGFGEARQAFLDADLPLKAAEMANNLGVALLQDKKPQQALEAVRGTPELFLDAGDLQQAGLAMGNLASVLEALGEGAEAQTSYQRAAELFEQIGDRQNQALTLKTLSQLQLRSGQPLTALLTMQASADSGGFKGLGGRILRRLLRIPGDLLGR